MNWKPPRKSISDLNAIHVPNESGDAVAHFEWPDEIAFEWEDLVMSLARTLAMALPEKGLTQEERLQLARSVAMPTAERINVFLEKEEAEFSFSDKLEILADIRPAISGEVGAAVADLVMEHFNCHWRSNGNDAGFVIAKGVDVTDERIPDFVYDPGGKGGFEPGQLIAVEAKGSLSKTGGPRPAIKRLAKKAFGGQVKKYLGAKADGCLIAAGYGVAYGSVPGSRESTLAIASSHKFQTALQPHKVPAPLSAAATGQPAPAEAEAELHHDEEQQEDRSKMDLRTAPQIEYRQDEQRSEREADDTGGLGDGGDDGGRERGGGRPRATPARRVALANYETVFQLCGALAAARSIRDILSDEGTRVAETADRFQEFYEIGDDEPILIGAPYRYAWWYPDHSFGISAKSAEEILKIIAQPGELPPSLDLSVVPFDRRRIRDGAIEANFQGDGFAFLTSWSGPYRHRTWDLREGAWAD
ncbi:hypothetical protein ABIC09_001892 [Bradyrhizobium sp. S3.12.5]|uniref:hypothetical protein n=1 Tax=Bradyrhizobium sp. S3.12.5 TaxID=3156386 RepID=UPI003390FA0C